MVFTCTAHLFEIVKLWVIFTVKDLVLWPLHQSKIAIRLVAKNSTPVQDLSLGLFEEVCFCCDRFRYLNLGEIFKTYG